MSRQSKTRAIAAVAGVASIAGVVPLVIDDQPAAADYITPWSRDDAHNMGATGLGERYLYGNSIWYDNNHWDDNEGADCSGYAGKVWQMSNSYNPATENRGYPSSTSWYNGGVNGEVPVDMYSGATIRMDIFDWQGHMGVFEGATDGGNQYKTWEAKGAAWGIATDYHTLQSLIDGHAAKRFKRVNW